MRNNSKRIVTVIALYMYQHEGVWYYWYVMDYMGLVSVTEYEYPYYPINIIQKNKSLIYLSNSVYDKDDYIVVPHNAYLNPRYQYYGFKNIYINGYINKRIGMPISKDYNNVVLPSNIAINGTNEGYGFIMYYVYVGLARNNGGNAYEINPVIKEVYNRKKLYNSDKIRILSYLKDTKNNFNVMPIKAKVHGDNTPNYNDFESICNKAPVGSSYIDDANNILKSPKMSNIPEHWSGDWNTGCMSGIIKYEYVKKCLIDGLEITYDTNMYFPQNTRNILGDGTQRSINDGYLVLLCPTFYLKAFGIYGNNPRFNIVYTGYDLKYVIKDTTG